jgi:hypothetical protein
MTLQLRIAECQRILDHAFDYAQARWVDGSHSFMDLNKNVGKPHIVNSSTAIAVISKCPSIFKMQKLDAYDGLQLGEVCKLYVQNLDMDREPYFWASKDTQEWSPYVTALVLKAIGECAIANQKQTSLAVVAKGSRELSEILRQQIHQIQDYLEKWAKQSLEGYLADYDHTFFAYTALEAAETIFRAVEKLGEEFFNKEDRDRRPLIKQNVLNRLRLDFYSHMTFKLADVPQHLDTVSLTLSMYCLAKYGKDRYQVPDDVLDAALNTTFSLQQPSGFWDIGNPLLGSATGRIGCSSIELAICLLRIPRTGKNFDQYFENFSRLLTQLSRGFDFDHAERGWPTDVRRNGNSYQTWYSFLVFEFLSLLSEKIREHAASILLESFNYRTGKPKLEWAEIGDYEGFKAKVETAFIDPRQIADSPTKPQHSMILFGPPGTGKTSIAHALAYKLKWGFVEIGPGDFLENGIDGIFAQGDLIFQRLLLLDHVVVLFDEIDELVSIRSDESDKLSKFLTTYMLPWLQRLRDKAGVVFIFATNHIKRFDPAIRRHGRFDVILPIGPPQGKERERILKAMKAKLGIGDSDIDAILADKQIPDQATIGDIILAINRAKGQNGFDAKACLTYLSPQNLLIKEEPGDTHANGNKKLTREWSEFVDEAKIYLS